MLTYEGTKCLFRSKIIYMKFYNIGQELTFISCVMINIRGLWWMDKVRLVAIGFSEVNKRTGIPCKVICIIGLAWGESLVVTA